jgi:pseudouridine-5'-phosphate glycosidase
VAVERRDRGRRGVVLRVSEEITTALADGHPVVALESTVISHGLPYPENVSAASRIEEAVRAGGAVPATVGIADGSFVVGMGEAEVERFASTPEIPKVSSRDVAVVMAGGGLGATTVASTLIAADLAGIPFFSTAGIGGVHRGAQETFDISADLVQFTRSKVAVVCAGAKSVLDIGLTLEYLETLGVPIVSFRSDEFPAFYSVSSGRRSPHRINDEAGVAKTVQTHWDLGFGGSVLVTHPIREEDAIPQEEIEGVIEASLAEAEKEGISGPAITPYLMKRVAKATEGRSAEANMAVLVSTAELAGRLAAAHSKILAERGVRVGAGTRGGR